MPLSPFPGEMDGDHAANIALVENGTTLDTQEDHGSGNLSLILLSMERGGQADTRWMSRIDCSCTYQTSGND